MKKASQYLRIPLLSGLNPMPSEHVAYEISHGSCLYMPKAVFQFPALEAFREPAGLVTMIIANAIMAMVMKADIRRVH